MRGAAVVAVAGLLTSGLLGAVLATGGGSPTGAPEGAWFAVEPGAARGALLASYGSFDLVEAGSAGEAAAIARSGAVTADQFKAIGFLQSSFDPLLSVPAVPEGYEAAAPAEGVGSLFQVQFRGPVRPEWKQALERSVHVLSYIPHSSYIVHATPEQVRQLESLPQVRWTGQYQPWYKVEPALLDELREGVEARILVDLFDFASPADIAKVGSMFDVERIELGELNRLVIGRMHRDILPGLARLDAVAWVQRYHDGEFDNGQAQWVVQSGQSNMRPVWDKGLHGEGQVVGYGDTGLDYDHIFFRDDTNPIGPNHRKVVGYKHWATNDGDSMGHGTHVAGSIAGNDKPLGGSSANIGEGYLAKLFVDDVSNSGSDWAAPADLNTFFAESYNASARLHSNSWGYPSEHTYTMAASTTDQFAWGHKDDYLIVIAAGNERGSGANSLRSPGLAKNIVTVGATENGANFQAMASFSSIGPTNPDGRLKPTVSAPGVNIMSADSDGDLSTKNSGEVQMSGTSMATPTTSGALSTLRQYFTEGWYPTGQKDAANAIVPTAALMKAVLMAGAVEITGTGSDYKNENVYPNNSQGWGVIRTDNSLYFAGDPNKLALWEEKTGIDTGETRTYDFDVQGTTQMLRIILVWTDYYGAVNANPAIVNDLDLEVADPSATKYLGNNFQGKNPGHSVTGGQPDRKNVEEGVLIPDATNGLKTGKWTITVRGNNIPQGPQPFAIAVTGDVKGGGGGSSISRVEVTPPTAAITADQTQQFAAKAFDTSGNQTNATFTWSATGGSVSASGLFTPGPVGTFTVSATAGTKVGSANITVTPGALASVVVAPDPANVSAGGTQLFTANGRDAKGNQIAIVANWSATQGTIDQAGSYTAPTALGSATVTATEKNSSKQGSAQVNIVAGPLARMEIDPKDPTVPADQNQLFTAKGFDAYGNPTPASPAWSATGGNIGAGGLYTPDKIGTYTITASQGGVTATTRVTVVPGKLAQVKVEPAFNRITADQTAKLSAKGFDSKGNEIAITPSWSATGGNVASDGTYTPDKVGTFTVTASSSGMMGSASVEVAPGRLAAIQVTPSTASISADATLALEAKGFDGKGNPLPLSASVSWTVDVDGGTVTPSGSKSTYRPQKTGEWTVKATQSGVTGEAKVTVTPGRLSSVKVDPRSAELREGDSFSFNATAYDINANVIPDVTWSWEVTNRLGTVSADGTFASSKSGEGKVVAKASKGADTAFGEAAVTVAPLAPDQAFFKMVGGQINGLMIIGLIIALVALAAVGAAVSKRRRRARESALAQMYGPEMASAYGTPSYPPGDAPPPYFPPPTEAPPPPPPPPQGPTQGPPNDPQQASPPGQ